MFARTLLLSLLSFNLSSCETFAVNSTPKKLPQASHSQSAKQAEYQFWKTLHQGNYQRLPFTTSLLTAAYLQNPDDPKLAAHLGFVHIWKITERAREEEIEPTITDQITLSKHYFQEAVQLNPSDARFQGFLGDSMVVSGSINKDQREVVRGYFQLKRAIAAWPEFNYFTAGYIMSNLPADSKHFKEGLEWQWKTLELCAGAPINRANPDFSPYLQYQTQKGPKRACWNSWIAPHNYEGFFLNMGDMLTKAGDWETAVKIYKNATLMKSYQRWPYKKMLEKRMKNAETNVAHFQRGLGHSVDRTILLNSGVGCAVCHQR